MNTLIAEDTPFLQVLNRELMNFWGYDFDMASNGREAVDYALVLESIRGQSPYLLTFKGSDPLSVTDPLSVIYKLMAQSISNIWESGRFYLSCWGMVGNIMKQADALSLKKIVLHLRGKSLTLQRADPADSDELNELRVLDKKGLAKFLVIDTSASFIADKDMLQKLIDDFSKSDSVLAEIADRSQQGHSMVQIYAANIWLRKSELTPAQFQKLVREEDLILEDYKKPRCK